MLEISEDDAVVEAGYTLTALESMLSDKGVDFVALRQRIAAGVEEAPDQAQSGNLDAGSRTERSSTPPLIGKARSYSMPLSPADDRDSPVVQDLSRRLQQAELKIASQELSAQQENTFQPLADAIKTLCEKATAPAPEPEMRNSTIKVEPRVNWPSLGDNNTGGRDAEEFFKNLEEIFGLANNGKGMAGQEKIVALRQCL